MEGESNQSFNSITKTARPTGSLPVLWQSRDPHRATIYPSLEEFRKLDDRKKSHESDIETQEASVRKSESEED